MYKHVLLSIALAMFHLALSSAENVQVSVKSGQVYGTRRIFNGTVVEEYLGIPYAEPPVGELRFQRPRPKVQIGDINATKWSDMCPQPADPSKNISEDCLYLNIWSFESSKELRPVMLFMHGGSYSLGSASQRFYYGLPLAAIGDVIVVTINYRLGAIGFLYSGNDEAPGNAGLLDQSLAMGWVKDNIEYFGGDPDKVTIFGESAGAMSVTTHILSPHSWDFFQNAILMSGATLGNSWITSKDVMLQRSRLLSNAVNCTLADEDNVLSNDTLDCMKKVDFEVLMKLQDSPDIVGYKIWDYGFVPIYGDEFLPEDPRIALSIGNYKKNMSILAGNTDDEGGILDNLIPLFKPNLTDLYNSNDTEGFKVVARRFLTDLDFNETTSNDAIELFFSLYSSPKHAISSLLGDLTLTCPTILFAELLAETNSVNSYVLTYKGTVSNDIDTCGPQNKVCHGDDLCYVFAYPFVDPAEYTDDDRTTSLDMIRIWTDFARTGGADWPGFMKTSDDTVIPRVLDLNPVRGSFLKPSFKHFLCKVFEKELLRPKQ